MQIHTHNPFEAFESGREHYFTDALADPHHPSAVVPDTIRSAGKALSAECIGIDHNPVTVTPQDIIGAKAVGTTPPRRLTASDIIYSD